MIKFGYKLMSEEHGPSSLVRNAVRAEQAGFEFAAVSDHFSPWLEEQGHSSFACPCSAPSRKPRAVLVWSDDGGDMPHHALPPGDCRPGSGNNRVAQQ